MKTVNQNLSDQLKTYKHLYKIAKKNEEEAATPKELKFWHKSARKNLKMIEEIMKSKVKVQIEKLKK